MFAASAPAGTEFSRRNFWLAALLPPLVLLIDTALLFTVDRIELMKTLQGWTGEFSDTLWAALTLLGNGAMLFACMALAWRHRPEWLMGGLCALPFAALISRSGKLLIVSPRPAGVMLPEQLHVVGEQLLNHSFPSGHTLSAFVVAAVIVLSPRPPRAAAVLALTGAVLVGLSRIAVGAHWPTDVLAGAAGGWLAGALGVAIARRSAWTRDWRTERLVALVILIASMALFFVNIGYTQAILFKYLVAAIGTISALRWLLAKPLRW